VWLIAAFLRSKSFKGTNLTVSDIDKILPKNDGKKMINTLSKFASYVYILAIEFAEECKPLLAKIDSTTDKATKEATIKKIATLAEERKDKVTDFAATLFTLPTVSS